jgi:hypothetical protein
MLGHRPSNVPNLALVFFLQKPRVKQGNVANVLHLVNVYLIIYGKT